MWDNGGRNMKLDQPEFSNLGFLSRDSVFSTAACGDRKGSNSLVSRLKHGPKDGPQ